MTTSGSTADPAEFRAAVEAMTAARVRPEIEVGPIRPPQRLAPYSHAVGAEVLHPDSDVVAEQSEGDAFGRLILLFDPDGDEAWNGTMRLVAYIQADLDEAVAADPLLPEVAWSWLVDALEAGPEPLWPWAVRSQPQLPCGTATSPGLREPINWSCERPGLQLRPNWLTTSRLSARFSRTRRGFRLPG